MIHAVRQTRTPIVLRTAPLLVALALLSGCATSGGGGGPSSSVADPAPPLQLDPQTVRVGGAPIAIAVDTESAWVADNARGTVRRLDGGTGRPAGPAARVGAGPIAIAVGEGGVWVASGSGTVQRIDPGIGKISGAPIPVADPTGIAAGGGGVWVTSRLRGTVTRIDPRSGRVTGRPIPVGRNPGDVAVGFGSVWVANTDAGTVSRLDARDGKPTGQVIKVGIAQVLALTVGREAVFVATTDLRKPGEVAVRRVDPRSGAVGDPLTGIPAGVPVDLAAGLGRVWITDVGSILPGGRRAGSVRPIDAPAQRLGRPVRVGRGPAGVAVGAGAVWTANAGDGTVTRVAVAR